MYFKDDVKDKKYLQYAHDLSRNYIKEEVKPNPSKVELKAKPSKVELKAIKEKNKWCIVKDNKDVVAENNRPLITLSEALKQTDTHIKQVKLCHTLITF
ncbi:hypothetical protein [Bacillus sp. 1NLA3E]|uniref:hypothetical protein n=1 Tax=Bacillus sp. 1NLA3E TaxID=666686 RepID=UPI000247E637|nr:hypothetical protein [Bacillus sp. 1NLA3E]AGK53727.1 hypothetical protein B1NLA3E_09845 [Bacillus sp. 1NLA3E]